MRFNFQCFGGVLAVVVLAGMARPAAAQFAISRFTIAGGGGMNASGGSFVLGGTIGQPDAGYLSGLPFTLGGGFWFGGGTPVSGVEESPSAAPRAFRLYPASPNPVMDRTVVAFDLPAPTIVRANLYDASGRLVRSLADETMPAGRHERAWDRRDDSGQAVPSGIFFLRLVAGTHRKTQKLVVVR